MATVKETEELQKFVQRTFDSVRRKFNEGARELEVECLKASKTTHQRVSLFDTRHLFKNAIEDIERLVERMKELDES